MTTLLDFLRIRTKLGVLVAFFLGALVILGWGWSRAHAHLKTQALAALEAEAAVREAQNSARAAQVHFKIQVQEWKNLLIRGHSEENRTRYRVAMDRELRETLMRLGQTEGALSRAGMPLPSSYVGLAKHVRDVNEAYQSAMSRYAFHARWDHTLLDATVQGVDRQPTEAFDTLVAELDALARQRNSEILKGLEAEFQRVNRRMALFLAGLFAAGAVLAWAIVLRLHEALTLLLFAHRRLQGGDLAARLSPGGQDELTELARSFNAMASELEQGHRNLEEARKRAEESSHVKSSFVASMSHELRTPLNAILGYAQLLEGSPDLGEEDRQDVLKIRRAGDHLLGLINDVLSIAKLESNQMDLHRELFSPQKLLDELYDQIVPRAEAKGIRLDAVAEGTLPAAVLGDQGRLRQVLLNLLANAVKFTETGGVALRARFGGGRARFSVEDTGPGMDEEETGKLFMRFQQTSAGRRSVEGAGLGLAISQGLVQLMGGRIQVDSEPGKGSRFYFDIALPEEEPALDVAPAGRTYRLARGSRAWRLLVVDDREENRDLLGRIFRRAGFTVVKAAGGEEALQRFDEQPPDLVWMDIRMPGMDGYETLAHIRERDRRNKQHTPVVSITASVFNHDETSMKAAGFDGFQGKPFREEDLFIQMAKLLPIQYEP